MTDAGEALVPGTRLDDLEIERVLGAGGFGITYLARDVALDVRRAVKEYLPREWATRRSDGTVGPRSGADAEDYQWGLERFVEEARILARFDNRHLVRVHRVFEARGTAYTVMEHVDGWTLKAEGAAGPLSEARVRVVLGALAKGLAAMHGAGLLHRDIKPTNVMVRRDGAPVLIDFGAARQAMGEHSRSVTAVLTPGYAPIEQYSARGNQGPWTDIYGLGALAYWALSGKVPPDATLRVRRDPLVPVAEAASTAVSGRLSAAVGHALAVDEEDRPQSLEEWAAVLEGPPAEEGTSGRAQVPATGAATATGVARPLPASREQVPESLPVLVQHPAVVSRRGKVLAAAAVLLVALLAVGLSVIGDGSEAEKDRMQFAWIPAGTFRMGVSSYYLSEQDERPVREVRISRGFWLGKYEVTQGDWEAVMGFNPSRFDECGADCPVESVSWEDVQEFLVRLNEMDPGKGYRLPTEAEWEYAARAGTEGDTYAGDLRILGEYNAPVLDGIAWYGGNSGAGYGGGYDCSSRCGPHPVGRKEANAWGLHDMLGNVWEWVQDRYGKYSGDGEMDPKGPRSGSFRVARGGGWDDYARRCRLANRGWFDPSTRDHRLGIRLIRTR